MEMSSSPHAAAAALPPHTSHHTHPHHPPPAIHTDEEVVTPSPPASSEPTTATVPPHPPLVHGTSDPLMAVPDADYDGLVSSGSIHFVPATSPPRVHHFTPLTEEQAALAASRRDSVTSWHGAHSRKQSRRGSGADATLRAVAEAGLSPSATNGTSSFNFSPSSSHMPALQSPFLANAHHGPHSPSNGSFSHAHHNSSQNALSNAHRNSSYNALSHTHRNSSVNQLRGAALTEANRANDWARFQLGFRCGALMLLAFWFLWDCIVDAHLRPSANNYWVDAVLPIYRCTGFLILAYWMWGINVWIWHEYKIKYLMLMELHPRTSDTHRTIFSNAITLSIVFLANFLMYFKMERGDFPNWFPSGIWPMLLFVLVLGIMCPWPRCGTPVKQWPMALVEVLMAPFRPVKFLHVFIGDVLTSLVKITIDMAYSFCYIFSGLFLVKTLDEDNGKLCLNSDFLNHVATPILSALPLWLRLLQCLRRYYDTRQRFPHMVNAGKYAVAASVVFIGVFHQSFSHGSESERGIWIVALISSTMYSYTWDVFMDWDLGEKAHKGLRANRIFGSRAAYYAAIVLDLFFRFAWTLTFVPTDTDSPLGAWFTKSLNPLVAGMEVVRRGVWSIFRVENEHLSQITMFQRQMDEEAAAMAAEGGQDDFAEQEEEEQEHEAQHRKSRGCILLLELSILVAVVVSVGLASYFTH